MRNGGIPLRTNMRRQALRRVLAAPQIANGSTNQNQNDSVTETDVGVPSLFNFNYLYNTDYQPEFSEIFDTDYRPKILFQSKFLEINLLKDILTRKFGKLTTKLFIKLNECKLLHLSQLKPSTIKYMYLLYFKKYHEEKSVIYLFKTCLIPLFNLSS